MAFKDFLKYAGLGTLSGGLASAISDYQDFNNNQEILSDIQNNILNKPMVHDLLTQFNQFDNINNTINDYTIQNYNNYFKNIETGSLTGLGVGAMFGLPTLLKKDKIKNELKESYLNSKSIHELQELNEAVIATLAIAGILGLLITALIQAGVDYFFSKDKINFKNKIRAVEAAFKRKRRSLPKEFEYIIVNYSPKSEYAKKGLFGIWNDMSVSKELFNPPSLFYTIKVKDEFDLEDTDIIVAQAKGNSKSFFVLAKDNKIYLVTKVSRVKKYDSYKDMLEKYFNIKLNENSKK